MSDRFAGQVAVVTGAGSGMGRAIVEALAAGGASVVAADRDGTRVESLAHAIAAGGGRALAVQCDVTADDDVARLAAEAFAFGGQVDLLFNHVGVTALGAPEKIPVDDWRWVMDVSVLSVVRALHAFLPAMIEQGSGHLINTASVSGLYPTTSAALPYVTAKFAVMGLSQGLYRYLKPKGVRVSCFCPAEVATNFFRDGQARTTDYDLDGMLATFGGPTAHTPAEAAAILLDGIVDGRFLIVTDPSVLKILAVRGQDLDASLDMTMLDLVTVDPSSLPSAVQRGDRVERL